MNLLSFPIFHTVTYNVRKNTTLIDNQYANIMFKVLTPDDLKTTAIHNQYAKGYDINSPQDINEIIGNV